MPKVSVIMAVYNREQYIRQAVESILEQTFQDFECLLVNDASTDKTAEVLDAFSQQNPRVKVLTNSQNLGPAKSRNKAIEVAKGEYLAIMDSDDVSLPTRLEKQVEFLDRNTEIGLLGSSWYAIDDAGQTLWFNQSYQGPQAVHFMCHGTTLLRKTCLEQIGYYRPFFQYAHDYDLYLRFSEKFTIDNLSQALYHLRIHENSISTKKQKEQALYAAFAFECAQERKKNGVDRLHFMKEPEQLRLRESILQASQVKKRKRIALHASGQALAAYEAGRYQEALQYIFKTHDNYILNMQAWDVMLKILSNPDCRDRRELFMAELTHLTRKGKSLCKKIWGRIRQWN